VALEGHEVTPAESGELHGMNEAMQLLCPKTAFIRTTNGEAGQISEESKRPLHTDMMHAEGLYPHPGPV
jgi:hypothetical protein